VLFVALIAYGNLRGVKESGRIFAIPTYFFIVDMVILLPYGLYRMAFTKLPVEHAHRVGMVAFGHAGGGLLMGVALSTRSSPASPTAAPRSPVLSRSPTVFRPFGHRSGATPARPWSS
jgi:hypothetical protein